MVKVIIICFSIASRCLVWLTTLVHSWSKVKV